MRRGNTTRQLAKAIKPFGLSIVEGAHRKIVNQAGQAVYWFGGSPSCPYFGENVLHDLVRMGLVPKALKQQRLRG